jgi:hypothetical protein
LEQNVLEQNVLEQIFRTNFFRTKCFKTKCFKTKCFKTKCFRSLSFITKGYDITAMYKLLKTFHPGGIRTRASVLQADAMTTIPRRQGPKS